MAKAEAAKEEKKKGGGMMVKILLLVVVILLLVGGGIAGGLYAMGAFGGKKGEEEHFEAPRLVPKSEEKRAGAGGEGGHGEGGGSHEVTPLGAGGDKYASNYYAIEKEFTSNLKESVHFIQVGLAVSTPYDDRVIEGVKTHEIAVRSAVLLALGETNEDEVFTAEGKRKLQANLVKAINGVLKQKEGFGGISNVYFTNFVVQ